MTPQGAATRRKLTDDQVTALRQRYVDGARITDIAEEFGIVHGSVNYHCADLPARREDQERNIGPRIVDFPPPPDWTEDAECKSHPDPDVFFPVRQPGPFGQTIYDDTVAYARSLCAKCPVAEQCLDYAMSMPPIEVQGIWAGTTENQRQKMRNAAESAA